MAAVIPTNSTTVRSKRPAGLPWALRIGVALGNLFAPETTGRRAESLFTSPLGASRRRALEAPLDGAAIETIPVLGETVTLYRWGARDRPLVLFSHGWSSFGLRVRPWVGPLLAAGYQVASFDQIAHGRSSGRHATLPGFGNVLAAVARHLGPSAAIIGHSLGGAAVGMALLQGARTGRVVLIAPPAEAAAAVRRFAEHIGLGRRALQRMRRAVVERAGVPLEAVAVEAQAPALGVPALIIHDLEDREVPWADGERYARNWPGARLLSVEGLGHHRIVGEPRIIDAGMRFLGGAEVGQKVVGTTELRCGFA
ncbi:alpha/beta fold hydrolase [Pseudomarimonas salicorniae]|uniref:Alpha/beta hydrolase n=1 Tax=Pseudomarimonas salicorniae TaxID=2933270 RepID=A0ABT0GIR2_9GAMM|nr:alpha/beta hydrolase [Lysobacter sp. CAU 1642]MCK7594444.1 alpha/beta hydrolase [Lysobacter sp. CAU 1642]